MMAPTKPKYFRVNNQYFVTSRFIVRPFCTRNTLPAQRRILLAKWILLPLVCLRICQANVCSGYKVKCVLSNVIFQLLQCLCFVKPCRLVRYYVDRGAIVTGPFTLPHYVGRITWCRTNICVYAARAFKQLLDAPGSMSVHFSILLSFRIQFLHTII